MARRSRVSITVDDRFDIDVYIKKFKNKVKEHGVMDEYRDHTKYTKPSVRKRKKKIDETRKYYFKRLTEEKLEKKY